MARTEAGIGEQGRGSREGEAGKGWQGGEGWEGETKKTETEVETGKEKQGQSVFSTELLSTSSFNHD